MKRTLLIDGDVLVYESAFAAQKKRYHYTPDNLRFESHADWKLYAEGKGLDYKAEQVAGNVLVQDEIFDEATALLIARNKLMEVRAGAGDHDAVVLLLTGKGNFREQLATTKGYKANRKDIEKPVHYQAVKDYYVRIKDGIIVNGEEADDAMGYMQDTNPTTRSTVICSIDKDLNCIPGKHYDWNKGLKYKVSEDDALLYFMAQCLSGDSTDNIPGIPGIGMTGALKKLRELDTSARRWQYVKDTYLTKCADPKTWEKLGVEPVQWEQYLTEQASLVWIRREEKEVWTIKLFEECYL